MKKPNLSEAGKQLSSKRWEGMTPDERKAATLPARQSRWDGVSDEEKKAHTAKMREKRKENAILRAEKKSSKTP